MRWTLIDYSNLTGKKKTLVFSLFAIILGAQFLFIFYQGLRSNKTSAPFSINVTPSYIQKGVIEREYTFLVTVTDEGPGSHEGESIRILAYAPGATVVVNPEMISPGEVAEVSVTFCQPSTLQWRRNGAGAWMRSTCPGATCCT